MKRVIYKKNPLVEVIMQIRFPKILALNTEDPISFQEAIKGQYPIYQLSLENQHEINFSFKQEIPTPSVLQKQPVKNHNFISADGTYKINLTSGFISISTVNYTRWEEFVERFSMPLQKFVEIYAPAFYERIGLRYIDAFSRKSLNIEGVEWKELIDAKWLGAYTVIDDEKDVISSAVDVEYVLDDNISRAKIHSGLGVINNSEEKVFILDSDFIYVNNIEPKKYEDISNSLHVYAKKFINDAISEKLHGIMEPEVVDEE